MSQNSFSVNQRIGILFLGLILAGFCIGIIMNSGSDIDKLPEEGYSVNYTTQARIVNGEELFRMLEGADKYDAFSKDLQLFAKTAYTSYKEDPGKVIGFQIASDISDTGDKISFTGNYGSTKNKISIAITLQKHNRIHVSITDEKTKLNLDEELPSNSKRNTFIATLPVNAANYVLDFNDSGNSFSIELLPEDPASIDQEYVDASEVLKKGLGISDIKQETVDITRTGAITY